MRGPGCKNDSKNGNSTDNNSNDDEDNNRIQYDNSNIANAMNLLLRAATARIQILIMTTISIVTIITLPNSPEGSFQGEPVETNGHN